MGPGGYLIPYTITEFKNIYENCMRGNNCDWGPIDDYLSRHETTFVHYETKCQGKCDSSFQYNAVYTNKTILN